MKKELSIAKSMLQLCPAAAWECSLKGLNPLVRFPETIHVKGNSQDRTLPLLSILIMRTFKSNISPPVFEDRKVNISLFPHPFPSCLLQSFRITSLVSPPGTSN